MATREVLGVDEVEPYSKIVKAGGLVFIKSHIGPDPETGEFPDDIAAQTRNTLSNLEASVKKAGSSLNDLVRLSVYLSDIDADFDGFDAACREWMRERGVVEPPARTTIGTPLSWPQLRVQMDLIAAG